MFGGDTLILPKDLGLSTNSHLHILNIEVCVHLVPPKVVHAGLPINEVLGLSRTVEDGYVGLHALLDADAMLITLSIMIVWLVISAVVVILGAR